MFTGTYTAIVTPFKNGSIDEEALERLVKMQIRAGVDGIVAVGTTGESPCLDYEEHVRVIEQVVQVAAGKIKVIAGSGANSTSEAVFLTKAAQDVGADGSLQVAPYYNKPSQEGLYQHFKTIAESTKIPIVLYSIPSRCGVTIDVETIVRLREACPNIVAIKEAGGDADRVSRIRADLDEKFVVLSGDDGLTLPFMAVGAQGVISVASNVIPKEMQHMVKSFADGKTAAALKVHDKYYQLFKDLFIETNPVPVKAALSMMGLVEEEFRLPLVKMNRKKKSQLKETMERCGILEEKEKEPATKETPAS